ncbi:Abi family protein [Campylobacter corcagiensis]|uniref:Abi family protein n=1 Tax=Campylobacter corcagiensis TaxID=1448857 RepID=A0A7M1LFF3_9BACT|nr:Abi family protein [Campylobacter corcagiensis]QOQ87309.1 Abi family protein [Campylobacter corcagiensis]
MAVNNKPKLSIQRQINKLKTKGIKFVIFSQSEAYKFLQNHSYLFKVKAYCNTFKEKDTNNKTLPYCNLDFAHLVDLSTIDMHFRRFVIRLTLDIEHALKTKLMRDFNLSNNDGYDIVSNFLTSNSYTYNFICREINKTNNNINSGRDLISTNQFILSKYGMDLAIWNFIEVIQFGHLIEFMKFFYSRYPNRNFRKIENSLFNVRCLRNGSAHNNSLLSNLKDNIQNPQNEKYNN